jgi:hypothetical protein
MGEARMTEQQFHRSSANHLSIAGKPSHGRYLSSLPLDRKKDSFEAEDGGTLTSTHIALRQRGFWVEPLLGTDSAKVFLVRGRRGEQFVVIDSCGSYTERAEILARIKERWPLIPAFALQHHAEQPLAGADLSIAGEFDIA